MVLDKELMVGQDVVFISSDGLRKARVLDTDVGPKGVAILGDLNRFRCNSNPLDTSIHVAYYPANAAEYNKVSIGEFPVGHVRYNEMKSIMERDN